MHRRRACCTDAICSWPAGSLCGMSFICTRGRLLGYQQGARFVLHARAARDYARRRVRTHRHGGVELVDRFHLDSFHLDSFHLSLHPLWVGGRHLVRWYHLLSRGLKACRDSLRRKRRVASRRISRVSRRKPPERHQNQATALPASYRLQVVLQQALHRRAMDVPVEARWPCR